MKQTVESFSEVLSLLSPGPFVVSQRMDVCWDMVSDMMGVWPRAETCAESSIRWGMVQVHIHGKRV